MRWRGSLSPKSPNPAPLHCSASGCWVSCRCVAHTHPEGIRRQVKLGAADIRRGLHFVSCARCVALRREIVPPVGPRNGKFGRVLVTADEKKGPAKTRAL